jgi:bacteriophage exclusion system BrxC/D-like protein
VTGKERATIRRLRAGIVPAWALEHLSVAYDNVKRSVDTSLERVLAQQQIGPLFVEGEWGVGKTHLLSYIQASARALGVPSALVNLDAHSSALNYPQRFYSIVAERITVERHVGLQSVLTHLLFDERSNASLVEFAHSGDAGDLYYPIIALCEASKRGEVALNEEQYAWNVFLGLDVNWSTYPYKRRAALARLTALAKMFGVIGLGGLVILFDEAETIDQLWNIRSRFTAYTTIGSLCQSPGLWTVFGITERFNRTLASDLERIEWDHYALDPYADWFLSHWKKRSFRFIQPPSLEREYAREVVSRVAELYKTAHECEPRPDVLKAALLDWSKNPIRNPRRLIRSVVERLDQSRALALPLP